ncbi:phage capsid protein [Sinorhizobium fredii]|uniref:phage capsid protein n=1 Tax=Rhizobium fredii TaxID=380 RepID=UPI003512B5A5
MTQNAPNWNTTQYSNRAMHIYQTKGNRLRPTVTQAMRIENNEKGVFWLAGKTKAKKIERRERNQPGNGERKKVEVPLATWKAFDVIEEYDVDRMSVDEKEVVYESGANALGRATDIEIYAQMATAVTGVTGLDFSAGAFNAANALTLCAALQNDKVPWDGNVYCGLPALQWNQLLANKVVNSADHVGPDIPFVKATDTRFWNGVNWFLFVEEDALDLYPVPGANQQDLFIWHKSAMGWANNTDLSVIPAWDNYENWWTINMTAKGAASPMQEGKGVKRFRTSSNSAIAIV